jgi:hypothetical protein
MTAPTTGRAHLTEAGARKLWSCLLRGADRLEFLIDYLLQHEPGVALMFGADEQEFRAGLDIRRGAHVMAGKAGGVS